MKKRAFTLVELVIVVAIIALLLMIVLPSLQSAFAITRRVICARNLYHISVAIQSSRAATGDSLRKPMPTESDWPIVAQSMLSNSSVLRCPEDHRKGVPEDAIRDLVYKSGIPPYEMLPFDPTALSSYGKKCCAVRRGKDQFGPYTEFVIEENPAYESAFVGSQRYDELGYAPADWSDNDGVWRAYDSRNGKRVFRLVYYTCGAGNELYYKGKLLWAHPLSSHLYPQDEIHLPPVVGVSYGLNLKVSDCLTASSGTVVLLDFIERIADPNEGSFAQKLDSPHSARHRGRHNVLFADGAVRPVGTARLYPQIHPARWEP